MSARPLALFAIGLLFGGGIGFAFATASNSQFDPHDHSDPAQHADGRAHHVPTAHDTHSDADAHGTPRELAGPAPRVALSVTPDPVSGWNLHLDPGNFRFAPDRAGGTHVSGEGHAHVYVNGSKVARLYGPWLHLPALPEGTAQIRVTLNGNDHRPFSNAGQPIAAEVQIPVPGR